MDSQPFWVTTIVAVLALSAVGPRSPGVWAQNLCPSGWEWNQNSLGQDPCAIVFALEAVYPDNSEYDCNTVFYSLVQACGWCLNAVVESWPVFTTSIGCVTVYVAQYPYTIPAGTRIPHWAFINVVTDLSSEEYSNAAAMQVGRDPEATPEPTTTSSAVGNGTRTTPAVGNPTGTSNSKSNTGAIVGGVVGGVVALIILAIVAIVMLATVLRWRSKTRVPPDVEEKSDDHMGHPPPSPTLTPTSTVIRHFAYHNTPEPQSDGLYLGLPEPQ